MALTIPKTLRLVDLRALAQKCGLQTSGTKPILTHRIHAALSSAPFLPPHTRVLSIDMGIRNLAFCVLDLPAVSTGLPSLHAWQRLALSTPTPGEAESFSPATLSGLAYALLRHRLLPQKPAYVLIERQRFRSMGSKHILEWTVRVNMLEAVIYGVLCALREEGVWAGEVLEVAPGKVGPFWVGDGEGEWKKERKAKKKNKGMKIDLVRGWLETGQMVGLGNEDVQAMAKRYMDKWDRIPGGRKAEAIVEEMGKLDDLADCLLQGMAWIQWQENKQIALQHGVEALLDQ
jgi:cruciform cutting endonuclease 1